MTCGCGFSTDYPECNGTHKIVKSIKDKIITEIENVNIDASHLNALGMKMVVIDIIKKAKGV